MDESAPGSVFSRVCCRREDCRNLASWSCCREWWVGAHNAIRATRTSGFAGRTDFSAVWGKETRFSCRVEAVFGPLCCAARVKSPVAAPGEPDPWLLLAGRVRAADAVDAPSEPFARAKSAGVPLAHRARAIAAMTAVARPSSRRETAQRRQPTAAADLAPVERTTPRHRWWRAPRLPRRGPLPESERSARTRCPRVRQRAQRGDRRRACSALGAQELGPARADPARRRAEARDAQRGRDRGGGDVDPELQQLTLDAHIAPARVLPRQPEDQAACLGRKRRTTRPAGAASAFALQQRPVPAAERLRADRKGRPPLGRKQPAHRSKQRTVSGRVLRPPPSAPQDRHLVAQDHDLELALTPAAGEQTNETAEEPVQQTGQQDAQSEPLPPSPPAPPSRPNRVSLPHRVVAKRRVARDVDSLDAELHR